MQSSSLHEYVVRLILLSRYVYLAGTENQKTNIGVSKITIIIIIIITSAYVH